MSEPATNAIDYRPLPSSGGFLSEDWAMILGCEPETLRKSLREKSIRTIPFGAKTIIDVEWFWQDLTAWLKMEEATVKVDSPSRAVKARRR